MAAAFGNHSLVFETCLAQPRPPFLLSASSIHAVDGAYSVDEGVLSLISERRFDEIDTWPEMLPATTVSDSQPLPNHCPSIAPHFTLVYSILLHVCPILLRIYSTSLQ